VAPQIVGNSHVAAQRPCQGTPRPRTDDTAFEPVDPRAAAVAPPHAQAPIGGQVEPLQVVRGGATATADAGPLGYMRGQAVASSRAASSRCAGMPQ
jgi:hypothetical protein